MNYPLIFPIKAAIRKATRFTTTMLAPAGRLKKNENAIPAKKQITLRTADKRVTAKKLLQTLMEVRAGKMIRLEIIMAPIRRIPITTVRAVRRAMSLS